MTNQATDLLLEYEGDPVALDQTIQALPGVACAMLGGPDNCVREDGHYVARVFGGEGAVSMFKFMVENQGYCKVIGPTETK